MWRIPIIVGLFCSCGPGISTGFEGDDEGWAISGNGEEGRRPRLEREGGNPGGHICGTDQLDGDFWYFVAPGKFLGDQSAMYGQRLTLDLKQGSYFNQLAKNRDVVLNGGGLAVVYNFSATPRLDWTPYSVRLDDMSRWELDTDTSQGMPATEDDMKTVLKSLTSLRIRGEFVDGPDSACLDNVVFGTP